MNTFRTAALAAATLAAGLSLAACAAGISNVTPARSKSPTPHGTPSAGAAASPGTSSQAASVTMLPLNAPIGSFPIPPGANVLEKIVSSKQIEIIMSSVTPAEESRFYVPELPRVGYQITGSIVTAEGTKNHKPVSAIEFAGHGYTGEIAATSGDVPGGVTLGNGKDLATVILYRK